jgi:hypothetical protein
MNAQAVREMLHRRPFEPFEIILSSGERHVVKHPEFAIVTANRVVVVDPDTEQTSFIALLHVSEIRILRAGVV